ncbi:hypothetical protein FIE12Z_3362 [Fusarium flagelliforme]|uniref:Uncharacterized protein n=2 Tax=Fusarium flagelliforme TaxID=2675880 RepID=A0A395MWY0_9HYPO|nr:hypothetical protein FIE12Z_3362 [Fusarium flagelliforme]
MRTYSNDTWNNGMFLSQMTQPPIGNGTISVAQGQAANHPLRWPAIYRPYGLQTPVPTASSADPMDTSSSPKKRTDTMAALVENPNDDDDDEDDDDYADDSGFFEETSEDESVSTMNDDTPGSDTDSGEEPDGEDKTSPIPSASNQHDDLASITRKLNATKAHLSDVKRLMSKCEEDLDLLDDDVQAVHDSFGNRNISDKLAQTYSKIKMTALEFRKEHSRRIYGEGLDRDFQDALDNAAATFAEEWVNILKRHEESRQRDRTLIYINWQKALKEVEIEDCKKTIDSMEEEIEELRHEVKAIKIIDRVRDLGVEGIKALIATGKESLEYTFNIFDIEEDEECTCCD